MEMMEYVDTIRSVSVPNKLCPMKPCVRRRPWDDPFFDEGNILCNLQYKQTTVSHEEIEEFTSHVAGFTCQVAGCHSTDIFNTTNAYELHYNSVHRNVCSVCRRLFPTFHLLDIHLLESHDAMFTIMTTKQNMYQCLVENCKEKFALPIDRKDHLITVHKYPSNFRFHRVRKPGKTKQRQKATAEINQSGGVIQMVDQSDSMNQMMDTVECKDMKPTRQSRHSRRVPNTICFGRGIQRTFQQKKGQKTKAANTKHWYQTGTDMNTEVNIEHVKMDSLATALLM